MKASEPMDPVSETVLYHWEEGDKAAAVLRKGGLVALPTETLYGLTASAENDDAVRMIYEIKGRDYEKPLSVLVTGMDMVEKYCKNIPQAAYRLSEKYWPGPLTMILEDGGAASVLVTAGAGTLGVRCPDHPLTLSILRAAGVALAAPSANPAGAEPARTARQVLDYFDRKIEGVADGGPCAVGVASTIVDLTKDEPSILREGGIPGEEILAFLKEG